MDKNEFLEKLAMALAGQVPKAVIEENIRYYDGYISEQAAKKIPLKEVLESLGDPRLIARSIIDANGGGDDMAGVYEDSGYYSGQKEENPFNRQQEEAGNFKSYRFSRFWFLFILVVVTACIFIIIGTVIGGIFFILRPLLIPLLILFLIYSIFRGPRRY